MRTLLKLLLVLGAAGACFAQTAESLSDQGNEFAAAKQLEKASEKWKAALKLNPDYFPALYNLGFYYYSQQQFAQAEPLLQRATHSEPDNFKAQYLLGAVYSKLNNVDAALLCWREALRLQPENLKLMQIMTVEYSKGRYFGEASALAQKLLKQQTKDPNVYFLAIKAAQDAGDYEMAAEVARRAAQAFPDSARANFEYGFHLNLQGKTASAMEYLQKSMAEDPAYEEPFFLYGNLLVDQGHDAEAIPYLKTAIRNRNDFVPARVVLARALMNQQKWQDAIAELHATIDLDPKHPQPHLLLSQIYFRLGDEGKAKAEKEISLRLRRENPTVLEAVQSRPFDFRSTPAGAR